MKKICILALLLGSSLVATTALAQQKTATTPAATSSVHKLMEQYRWSEARTLLEGELASLKRLKKPTTQVEADLRQVQRAQQMMEGTEKVVFIDSLVVSRDAFLQAFPLSSDCGKVGRLGDLMKGVPADSPAASITAYRNQLADIIFYHTTDTTGVSKLCASSLIAGEWTAPTLLPGLCELEGQQGYPFVMQDGQTLYFAAQTAEGLGGYDIYVTRYNAESKSYVHPENIGMPFNSPANDYMYVVDELSNVGWFVTDRRQPADKVCIYFFQPNTMRETFAFAPEDVQGKEQLRRAARIMSIAETQTDAELVADARQRLHATPHTSGDNEATTPRFVINDQTVYTSLQQFKSDAARRIAEQWQSEKARLVKLEQLLESSRKNLATTPKEQRSEASNAAILKLEQDCSALAQQVKTLEKNMRSAELQ